jgi:hypothetical protein
MDLVAQIDSLAAPAEDRGVVVVPPSHWWPVCFQQNRARLSTLDYDLQGRRWSELIHQARADLLQQALRHTGQYRDVGNWSTSNNEPVPTILAGHQPQLFHPGVWSKNFALAQAAPQLGAVAINLIIDNDVAGTAALRVPTGSVTEPRVESVVIDTQRTGLPIEEQRIGDRSAFDSFGQRAAETVSPLVPNPLLRTLWPLAQQAAQRTNYLGSCLAQARHQYEQQVGIDTLEVPLSQVCDGPAFAWLVAHLLAQLPRFHSIYNACLARYRRRYRVRSRSHPAPDLGREGQWLEAPFWLWTADRPLRQRMFARPLGAVIEITDRDSVHLRLRLTEEGSAETAVQQLAEHAGQGLRIRPRALTTTMFARLLLGDLFVHGIGGAKYDRLTNWIIAEFFGAEPPAFAVVSATFRLPIARPEVTSDDLRQVDRLLRELCYHPETQIADAVSDERIRELVEAKRTWIARSIRPTAERHGEVTQINAALANYLEPVRQQWMEKRRLLLELLRKKVLLSSREYSFCLFPQETLFPFLLELFAREP